MAAPWMRVTTEHDSKLPTMLVQAITIASVLCVGEIVCAPIFLNLSHNLLALVPWAMLACLLAVGFTYTVGFAVLWCVETFASRVRQSLVPLAYGAAGLVSFAAWGVFVFTAMVNSILLPSHIQPIDNGSMVVIGVNCAALGAAAFVIAYVFSPRLAKSRIWVIVLGVLTLVFAAFGVFYLSQMYAALY